jgi:hypothetical protein
VKVWRHREGLEVVGGFGFGGKQGLKVAARTSHDGML